VFWFVLFINAVNLIDGLDGLAAGIIFFASLVLIILSVVKGEYLIGMLFAALAGACLGFLRYNFNPASIFMGDSGSYFLGYAIAGLSIMGSIKSQVGAAMLIPVMALGIPLFDTILSPIRRFVRGRKMFHPDKGHVHHRLVEMGLTTKKVVWMIYAMTFSLCLIRKLGYFEYVASDKIYGWFKDLSDEAGFSHDRRSFLNLQIEIEESGDLKALWVNVCRALEKLKFDMGEMDVRAGAGGSQMSEVRGLRTEDGGRRSEVGDRRAGSGDRRTQKSSKLKAESSKLKAQREEGMSSCGTDELKGVGNNPGLGLEGNPGSKRQLFWTRDGFDSSNDICKESLLKLELPLIDNENKMLGTLWLIKDLNTDAISHYTLRRVEHLRRTVIGTLGKMRG
jgi:UDP-GlcNAc:undecaprenyl-phosphate GlcNAc-1-phosphate transferase